MKKHRLNIILDKCRDNKFKKGFIIYLQSLDFDEFELLFNYYTSIISRLIFRYKNKEEKVKIFSKKWLRNKFLNYKYQTINLLFYAANSNFVKLANKKISDNNKRMSELITKIKEINKSIEAIKNVNLTISEQPSMTEVITLITILIEYIHNKNESEKIMNEINKLNK